MNKGRKRDPFEAGDVPRQNTQPLKVIGDEPVHDMDGPNGGNNKNGH
jgi:hypothetical protein